MNAADTEQLTGACLCNYVPVNDSQTSNAVYSAKTGLAPSAKAYNAVVHDCSDIARNTGNTAKQSQQ
jgi:hypothetical protein